MSSVLLIGGSDSSGGAGIQADIETVHAFSVRSHHIITSLTVQNPKGLCYCYDVPDEYISLAFDTAYETGDIKCIKTGMLANESIVNVLIEKAKDVSGIGIILDPVYESSTGIPLITESGWELLKKELLRYVYLITPNLKEAELLSGVTIQSLDNMEMVVRRIAEMGPECVIVKGGHCEGEPVDVLYDGNNVYFFKGTRIKKDRIRGTGCRFAAAIAALLVNEVPLSDAVTQAKKFVFDYIKRN